MEARAGGTFGPVFLGLGSNLGDRFQHLSNAVQRLAAHPSCYAIDVSSVYETPAKTLRPSDVQPEYLNAVLRIRTDLVPRLLIQLCHAIENDAGRRRSRRWGPRSLDIDVLAFGEESFHAHRLIIPHPRLAKRNFVLIPWAELASDWHVPIPFDQTVAELLAACDDTDPIRRVDDRLDSAFPSSRGESA